MNHTHSIRRALLHLLLGVALFCAGVQVLSGGAALNFLEHLTLAAAILAALVIVALAARFDRYPVAASGLAAGGYAVVRVTLVADGSVAGIPNGMAAALEAVLLLGLAWLTRRLVQSVGQFEESMASLMLPEFLPLVEGMAPAHDSAHQQFQIALRHGRPMSAVVLETGPGLLDSGREAPPASDFNYSVLQLQALGRLAKLVSDTVRQTDFTMKAEGYQKLILLCPETASEGAVRMAEKICAAAEEKLGQPAGYGVASFPDEAFNLEELVHQADSKVSVVRREEEVEPGRRSAG